MFMSSIPRFAGGYSYRGTTPLSDDDMRRLAPSVFAEDKHESRSDRYTYIPTIEIVRGMKAEGFLPYAVQQGGSRDPEKRAFTKHLIRFRKPDDTALRIGDDQFEVALLNSHDGTSSYRVMAGFFRMICTNGLVVAKEKVADVRVPHKGDIVSQVIEGTYTVVGQAEAVIDNVADMRAINLDSEERHILARSALALRYEGEDAGFGEAELLRPRRVGDDTSDLWTSFNTVQENLLRGGQWRRNRRREDGSRIADARSREVKALDQSTQINRALWQMAEMLREHKAGATV